MSPDGAILNTCSSSVLVEVLRYLKRAYWPFPWEAGMEDRSIGEWAGGSGFMGAATVSPCFLPAWAAQLHAANLARAVVYFVSMPL